KKKKSVILRVALLAFSVYVIVSMVQLQLQLNRGQEKLDDIKTRYTEAKENNIALQDKLDGYEEYLEQQARKQGLVKPGETVFVEIPE
ncbi:MAG: septum formation initiator family protein, partial [Clostridia bacterium]|nr:septum formation initiator family protein [Clostridia bacterium]